MQKITN